MSTTTQSDNSPTAISLKEMMARHTYLSYSWWTKPDNKLNQPTDCKIGGKRVFFMDDVLAWEQSRGQHRSISELKQSGGSLNEPSTNQQ